MKQSIVPFLWFDGRAEEALKLYTELFPNSEILALKKWGTGAPFNENWIMNGDAIINGLRIHAFDAGPMFKFNEAISMMVNCKDQTELDHYWNSLIADGGSESMCGWCKDRFGVSWQIVPAMLGEHIAKGDSNRLGKMMAALTVMKKLDIAQLEAAYNS